MQEEVIQRTVALCVEATKLSAGMLQQAMKKVLDEMRRYWFSDSYKDIAEFMGLSEKNISVRLTRIREKMKQYLIEREVFV